MIIVTGAAGFIGSNLVKRLNQTVVSDILAVDDLTDGKKIFNLADCDLADYLDKDEFLRRIKAGEDFGESIGAIFHQGACSTTTEWDGRFMMDINYEYSKHLLHYSIEKGIPFYYASSASVYGSGTQFSISRENERPINAYAFSKLMFDQYVRRILPQVSSPVVGLRYFNVYGPREQHKGSMASVVYHFSQQLRSGDTVNLFSGSDGYGDGEQMRDFIYVDDVVAVNLWLLQNNHVSGIFNLGTGQARSFNDVANAVIARHGRGSISYIPFPEKLKNSYQSFTQADIEDLRSVGFSSSFTSIEEGVARYLDVLTGDDA